MERFIDGRSEAELLKLAERQTGKKTTPSHILQNEEKVPTFVLSGKCMSRDEDRVDTLNAND